MKTDLKKKNWRVVALVISYMSHEKNSETILCLILTRFSMTVHAAGILSGWFNDVVDTCVLFPL